VNEFAIVAFLTVITTGSALGVASFVGVLYLIAQVKRIKAQGG